MGITEPNENDVLCGKSLSIRAHEGNKKFLKLIHDLSKDYEAAPNGNKVSVVNRVMDAIVENGNNGRFLQKNKGDDDTWVELEKAKALGEIAQAFRDLRAEGDNNRRAAMSSDGGAAKKTPRIKQARRTPKAAAAAAAAAAASPARATPRGKKFRQESSTTTITPGGRSYSTISQLERALNMNDRSGTPMDRLKRIKRVLLGNNNDDRERSVPDNLSVVDQVAELANILAKTVGGGGTRDDEDEDEDNVIL